MEKPVLYINACVRKESGTRKLAEKPLMRLAGFREEIRLENMTFPAANEKYLRTRDRLIAEGEY